MAKGQLHTRKSKNQGINISKGALSIDVILRDVDTTGTSTRAAFEVRGVKGIDKIIRVEGEHNIERLISGIYIGILPDYHNNNGPISENRTWMICKADGYIIKFMNYGAPLVGTKYFAERLAAYTEGGISQSGSNGGIYAGIGEGICITGLDSRIDVILRAVIEKNFDTRAKFEITGLESFTELTISETLGAVTLAPGITFSISSYKNGQQDKILLLCQAPQYTVEFSTYES